MIRLVFSTQIKSSTLGLSGIKNTIQSLVQMSKWAEKNEAAHNYQKLLRFKNPNITFHRHRMILKNNSIRRRLDRELLHWGGSEVMTKTHNLKTSFRFSWNDVHSVEKQSRNRDASHASNGHQRMQVRRHSSIFTVPVCVCVCVS